MINVAKNANFQWYELEITQKSKFIYFPSLSSKSRGITVAIKTQSIRFWYLNSTPRQKGLKESAYRYWAGNTQNVSQTSCVRSKKTVQGLMGNRTSLKGQHHTQDKVKKKNDDYLIKTH